MDSVSTRPRARIRFQWLERIDYASALDLQNRLVEQRRRQEIPDTVLLLEHQPVYTIGRTRDRSSLVPGQSLPHPVVEISRGGKATYHGPGQLIGYPILDLAGFGKDLHRYLRALEDALISLCLACSIPAARDPDRTGVWVGDRKIASIGVGVRHWISMHGFALNVCGDLSPFESIVPCGIAGVTMTSMAQETGSSFRVAGIAETVQSHLLRELAAMENG